MKTKIGLFLFTMLVWTGMGFAAPEGPGETPSETPKSYYNLTRGVSNPPMAATTLVLSQSTASCTGSGPMAWGMGNCIASVEATPENLAEMLDTWWGKLSIYKGATLELGSDIDLGEFASETKVGTCVTNHVPIIADSAMFDGKGYTIRHLCYAATSMTGPVGFFEKIERMTIQNVKFNGVRIYIDGESTDGKDYFPVGALAGIVNYSSVDAIELANDSIQAPFAGGLVGLVKNATLSHIKGDDDINVSNKVSIAKGFAGSGVDQMQPISGHNVFLGGLVGVAVRSESAQDSTFADDSVKVEVHDYGTGNRSALGGIAGYFKTIGDTVENLQVFTKYKYNGEIVPTKISGGASMGGLFGVLHVYTDYNTSATGKFVVRTSKFDGKIYDAASPNVIAVGGLLGLDSIDAGRAVRVMNSASKMDAKDSLTVAGNYRYYAGGIVGYGGSCNSGSGNGEEYLSVTTSKTDGSITLSASGAAVEGLHSDAYLGGVVGYACLAQTKGLGLVSDTSSVKITSKVKTAVDNLKKSNNNAARDSVYVGGVIGYAKVAVAKPAILSGLYYDGSIAVEDSLNNVFVGGILGGFSKIEGAKSLQFENVVARNAQLIFYQAKETAKVNTTNTQVTNVGGLCGVCDEIGMMDRVGVSGNISVTGSKYAGNSLLVGGLVGSTYASEAKMELHNAFSIGDINVSANNSDGGSSYEKRVGYLFGKAVLYKAYDVKSAYHYGEKDSSVDKPFGFLTDETAADNWRVNDNIHYVVRNAKENVLESSHHNGTVNFVKSSEFAGFLNAAYDDEKDYAWSFVPDANDNFPIFEGGSNKPIKPDDENCCLVVFVDINDSTIKQDKVTKHGSATAPTAEEMEQHQIEGYTFTGNWKGDYEDVTENVKIVADYSKNTYLVRFFNFDGSEQVGADQLIEYNESATAPDAPTRKGYDFVAWSDLSYRQVKSNLDILATYTPKKFLIAFENYNGETIVQAFLSYDTPVSGPANAPRENTSEYTYVFKGWTPEVTRVQGDAVYTAVFDSTKVKYAVVFADYDDTQIGDTVWVEYGDAAVAPAEPTRKGYTFAGWDRKFDKIVKNLDVKATYEEIPESSSSVEISSSSEPESSSSVEESSSSEEIASSSSSSRNDEVSSSSSIPVVSSSSIRGEIKIVKPTIKKSGNNAIRLTFGTENVDESAVARVFVICEKDTVWKDSIQDLIVGNGEWELVPAPIGKFKVVLTVDDKVRHAVYVDSFEVASEIKAAPGSWQMVSLSAFDKKKVKADDALFYWWDEKNPVGDYWQYRAFNGEKTDATRGFWYGTTEGNPLVIRESTGSKDSEIVWELDSLYSGWNLVANPYGWNVNLTKGAADNDAQVTFWRWNPTTGNYDPKPKVIGPYEAVWAKVTKSTTWRMSAAPEFKIDAVSAAETKTAMHKDAADVKGAWSLMVSLADDYGRQDSWNVIGAGAEESLDEPPAGMGNRVSLAIRNSEKGAKLAKSIKAVADEYSWILDVSASSMRDGKLKFEGIKELNSQGLKLFVTADGVTTEITNEKSMNVALARSAKQVEVRVAAGNAVVASSKISGFGSTLAGGTLQVGFTAPDALAGARASYAVVGVDGKKVASGSFKATSGTNQFSLNAPKTGVYFVKIKVGSQQLSGKVLVK